MALCYPRTGEDQLKLWDRYLEELHQRGFPELDFCEAFISCFELVDLSAAQLCEVVREMFKCQRDVSVDLSRFGLSQQTCTRLEAILGLLRQAWEMRLSHLHGMALRAIFFGLAEYKADISPRGDSYENSVDVSADDMQVAVRMVEEVTGLTIEAGRVMGILKSIQAQFRNLVQLVVLRHISTSNLGAVSRRNQARAQQQMSQVEDEESRLTGAVIDELRRFHEGVVGYTDDVAEVIRRSLWVHQQYYEKEVDGLVVAGYIRQDLTQSIDEILQRAVTLIDPPDSKSLMIHDSYWDASETDSDLVEVSVTGQGELGPRHEHMVDAIGSHRDFVEMYTLRQYGGVLGHRGPLEILPSSPSGKPCPMEVVYLIIEYTLPWTNVGIGCPDAILGSQWVFRTSGGADWSHYMNLCRVSTAVREIVQEKLMGVAAVELKAWVDDIAQGIDGVEGSLGPRLQRDTDRGALCELRHRIPKGEFALVRELDLRFDHIPSPYMDCGGILPVLDTLTGLKEVTIFLPSLDEGHCLWLNNHQMQGCVMHLLSHILSPVEVVVCVDEEALSTLDTDEDGPEATYQQVILQSWIEVVREAFAVDRRESTSTLPIYERPELRENILVMRPGAHMYEWRLKTVQRQQDWLRQHGYEEEASDLGRSYR